MKAGAVYKYDLSLPVEKMYELVEAMRTRLGKRYSSQELVIFEAHNLQALQNLLSLGNSAKVIGYGHLGDGNLHLNISTPQYDDAVIPSIHPVQLKSLGIWCQFKSCVITSQVLAQIEPFVYEWTSNHRGSISAEHGLGLMKANKIFYSKSPEIVRILKTS